MPIVAKDKGEYELKRQGILDDYARLAEQRSMYRKSKEAYAETGGPLYQPGESKTTLENVLDKTRLDENLQRLLVNKLNANVGQVKTFLASLDDVLKEHLLDRMPAFLKIFEQNFTIASSQALKATLDLFQKGEIARQKDIDVPTIPIMKSYLEGLSSSRLTLIRDAIFKALNKFAPQRTPPPAPGDEVATTLRYISRYVSSFQNDVVGYSAVYSLLKKQGFDDIPRPKVADSRSGAPSPFIQVPIQEQVVAEARAEPFDVAERLKATFSLSQLKNIAKKYNILYDAHPNPALLKARIGSRAQRSKPPLAKAIAERNYNIITSSFDIPSVAMDAYAELGSLPDVPSAPPRMREEEELEDLPDVPSAPPRMSGSGFARIYRL
jgi:hypothetical protein